MNKSNRVKALEEKIIDPNGGLRVVFPIGCFYEDEECQPYWTDEAPKGMEAMYNDEPYRRVEHPDGIEPTMRSFTNG